MDGFLSDAALAGRAALFAPPPDAAPVAVIGLDARTLAAPELADLPRVFFGPAWARLLDATFADGARAVGFDILFAYSANRVRPDYDRSFLAALARYHARVVLARDAATLPADPFLFAVGAPDDPQALGRIELAPDADGVYRRVNAALPAIGVPASQPSLAAALLARAGFGAMPDRVLIAPWRPLETIPTYSMIDVLRCAASDPRRLARRLAGRIVLVGTILPEEDRKRSAGRFLPAAVPSAATPAAAGCELTPLGPSIPGSTTVPGLYLHAAAIAAVAGGGLIRDVRPGIRAVAAGTAGALGCLAGFAVAPGLAAAAALAGLAGLFALEILLLRGGVLLPLAVPMAALILALGLAYGARYAVERRQRHRLQAAFGRYLAPSLVAGLADLGEPSLGGETRTVTVLFADLSGFTRLSGTLGPAALVEITNAYLGLMVAEIERRGGYVDKFIGDAVMALWNAPLADADHAVHAVDAALAIARRVAERAAATPPGDPRFAVKIGLESGLATVGNVGSAERCNYTAIGETVNLAARLESVPADYGCAVVIGETAAGLVGGTYLLRELDAVVLRGRARPLAIFEPVCRADAADEPLRTALGGFAHALELYRGRRFGEAERLWRDLAAEPASGLAAGPAVAMAARAAALAAEAPASDWVAVSVRRSK